MFGIDPLGHIGYWAAACVTAVMCLVLYDAAGVARHTSLGEARTVKVLIEVSALSEAFSDALAAQRGFLLLGRNHFLLARDTALIDAQHRLAAIDSLTGADEAQKKRLGELGIVLEGHAAAMRADEVKYRANEAHQAGARWQGPEREVETDRLQRMVKDLRTRELGTLREYHSEQDRTFAWARLALVGAAVISITLMIPGYIIFIRQSRARIRAEMKLVELTETVPGALFQCRILLDGSLRYEFLSQTVDRLRLVDREAALKDSGLVLASIVDEDRAGFLAAVRAATRDMVSLEWDFRVRGPAGDVRWLRETSGPRRQPDGTVLWSGHWSDVTERLALRHALEESKAAAEASSDAKTTFLTTMSHEIRTPMNGVLGMLELVTHTDLDAEQRPMIAIVQDSGKALLRIIDDILDFSKIEAGKLDLVDQRTRVAEVVEAAYNAYQGIALNKGLVLTRAVDDRLSPELMVDSLRLRQVLGNLLSNAIKFTAHGSVELRADLCERVGDMDIVRFAVRDTGIGISEEAQKLLFRPYEQGLADRAHQFGGTGLGLAICRKLATMMGGSIEMTSKPGEGTLMVLTVPMRIAAARLDSTQPLPAGAPPEPAPMQVDGPLVLLAEDHPVNRIILVRQLNRLGYAAEMAADGREALEKWRSGKFGLIVTDCNMPEMSGYDLSRAIRRIEEAEGRKRTPIIACTAYAILGEADTCRAAGMDDYLAKPVDLMRLREKLDKWLPLPALVP
jgi:signal transduction histidine kinase/CHASE3 domain sensor protein/ActR/RegA family two-component response regulator